MMHGQRNIKLMTGYLLLPVLLWTQLFFHFFLYKQLEQKGMTEILQHMY